MDAALARKRGAAELFRPVEVLAARSDRDELQRPSVPRRPGSEFAEFFAVLGGRQVAATSPGLIAYAPIPNVVGFAGAVIRALPTQSAMVSGRVAVLNPVIESQRAQAANVGSEVGLSTGEA